MPFSVQDLKEKFLEKTIYINITLWNIVSIYLWNKFVSMNKA